MSRTAIKIEDLSKMYRLGEIGTGTVSHDLNRWWTTTIRGKEDPYTKISQQNDRTLKAEKGEHVWALRDIDLNIRQGEVMGIIGKNGAGKSTLLKLLSRVTAPTTGTISTKGRMASLLEVGTGFHPEMTGRENIYMNGTIMGMRRHEISKKLDEIVEFAGVAKYLDTPVKRYSSGMTVRLGFAVAAFLEPEILIVDEVLAVGDFEFQKRAIGKMKEVAEGDGRTVLFVSHNMASIKNLCTSGMVLQNGRKVFEGSSVDAVQFYTQSEKQRLEIVNHMRWPKEEAPGNDNIRLLELKLSPLRGEMLSIDSGIKVEYTFSNTRENINLGTTLEVTSIKDELLIHQGMGITTERDSRQGIYKAEFQIADYVLNEGQYKINLMFGENKSYRLLKLDEIMGFQVAAGVNGEWNKSLPGLLYLDLKPKTAYLGDMNASI